MPYSASCLGFETQILCMNASLFFVSNLNLCACVHFPPSSPWVMGLSNPGGETSILFRFKFRGLLNHGRANLSWMKVKDVHSQRLG